MARILYFSTHEALEYDDIRLFQRMGHTVFSLGVYCPANVTDTTLRPAINYGQDVEELTDIFRADGCSAIFMDVGKTNLSHRFLNTFDIVISVQDVDFIRRYWVHMDNPKVIWRTVGQAIEHHDAIMAPYRDRGLTIVRWCARERNAPVYIGHDAIIRAYKSEHVYCDWLGDEPKAITFSNHFRQRYPIELGLLERVLSGVDYAIGGLGNENVDKALGLLPLEKMQHVLRHARAYFYCHGSTVPYTLNFVEAWMTGIPVIAARKDVEIANIDMRYNEINDFIIDGDSGFLFKSERQACETVKMLMNDFTLAQRVGRAGRKAAIRLFGEDQISADWSHLFASLQGAQMSSARTENQQITEKVPNLTSRDRDMGAQDIQLYYRDWGLYNNPEVNERKAELPIAFWFVKTFPSDLYEVGEVTPFYDPTIEHPVFDSLPEKENTIKEDAMNLDYSGRNLLSISTIEHVGAGDYGHPVESHKAFALLKKMTSTAKNYIITFAVDANIELQEDLVGSGIPYFIIERSPQNTWAQVKHRQIHMYKYGTPLPHGNAIIVVTNLNVRFIFS